MRGIYTASFRISGVTITARTAMYLTAPATAVVEILRAHATNDDNDTNEQIQLALQRITSLGSPTATAVTPGLHEPGDQAAGSTVAANVTASEPTYAAANVSTYGRAGAPSLHGWHFEPLSPAEYVYVAPSASLGLRVLADIAASTSLDVEITFREIG